MAISSVVLRSGTPQTIYQSVGSSAITTMYLCNKTELTCTANLFLVPNAGAVFGNAIIYSNVSIAANDTLILEWERILLDDGDQIAGNVSAGLSLVATTSYTGI